ncbi:MAG: ABC transporter permease subunit, partial [Alphaproteobacteria bacterium]
LPKGQTEAARSLGLRYGPMMLKVILPQALYNAMPGILNQLTAIIKETSLGYLLAVSEITYTAGQINSLLLTKPFQIFAILAVVYFVLCYSLTSLARVLEHRIGSGRNPVTA